MAIRSTSVLSILGFLFASTAILGGCSVYHSAGRSLPAEPTDRLALRLQQASDAARDLRVAWQDVEPGADDNGLTAARDAGRLESLNWEFDRRLASVDDVSAREELFREDLRRAMDSMRHAARLSDEARRVLEDGRPGLPEHRRAVCDSLEEGVTLADRAAADLRSLTPPRGRSGQDSRGSR